MSQAVGGFGVEIAPASTVVNVTCVPSAASDFTGAVVDVDVAVKVWGSLMRLVALGVMSIRGVDHPERLAGTGRAGIGGVTARRSPWKAADAAVLT